MGDRLRGMADLEREELFFLALHMSPVYRRKVSVQDHMYREKIFLAIPHLYRKIYPHMYRGGAITPVYRENSTLHL